MSGEQFDYRNERQRHEKFVGRAGLLARLDQLLVGDGPEAVPAKLGASVLGDSSVSCWVPSSLLGATKNGAAQQGTVGTGSDGEVLVEDIELSSPQCSALKAWHHS